MTNDDQILIWCLSYFITTVHIIILEVIVFFYGCTFTIIFNWLFKSGDVSEGTKKKNNHISFIFHRRHLEQEPEWCSYGIEKRQCGHMYKWSGIQVYIHWVMAKPKVEFQTWKFQRIWWKNKTKMLFFLWPQAKAHLKTINSPNTYFLKKMIEWLGFSQKANSVTLSRMVCDVSTLHIGCISPADQMSSSVCKYTRSSHNAICGTWKNSH